MSSSSSSSANTDALPPSTPKRDHLLETAFRLFYRDGYHAVGIDRILAEAKLAKMTLYHHFASKEELIVAVLERRAAANRERLLAKLDAAGSSPRKRFLALFDWYTAWFESRDFNGCAFIRAGAEYTEASSPVHQAVARTKERHLATIRELVGALEVSQPDKLAAQILLLLEGAIVSAHLFGDPASAMRAREAALTLVAAAQK